MSQLYQNSIINALERVLLAKKGFVSLYEPCFAGAAREVNHTVVVMNGISAWESLYLLTLHYGCPKMDSPATESLERRLIKIQSSFFGMEHKQ